MLLDIIWSIVTWRRIRETDRVYLTYRKYHETLESKIDTGNGIVIDGMEWIKTEFSLIKNMKDVPNWPDWYKSVTMAKPKTASIWAYFFPNTQLIPPGYEWECWTNPQLFGDRDFIKAFDTQLAHQIDKADIWMYLIKIFGGKNNIAVNTSLTDRRQISKSWTVFSFTRHNWIEATSFVIEVYPIGDNWRIAGEQKAVDALALKKSAWANGLLLGWMWMYIHEVQRVRTPWGSNQAVRIVDSVITPEWYIIDPNAQWEELLRSAKPEVKEKYSQTNSPV